MKLITTEFSKKRNAPYSPAVAYNGILYVSGQLSLDPQTGKVPPGGIVAQTHQALKNLDEVLKAGGATRFDVLQCRLYTPDISYWDEINKVYVEFFGDHKPARVVVPTNRLHFDCLLEIEALAVIS